jgi:hypothetical protein
MLQTQILNFLRSTSLTSFSSAFCLVHRLISGRHTAVGDLADFQGASDEHTEIRTGGTRNAENRQKRHRPSGLA